MDKSRVCETNINERDPNKRSIRINESDSSRYDKRYRKMLKTDDKIERIVRKSRRRAKIIIREEQRREIETGRKKSGDTEQTIASTCNRYNNPEYINKPNILI